MILTIEILRVNPKKACKESDIPVNIKKNLDIVSNCVYNNLNNSVKFKLPIILKKCKHNAHFFKKRQPTLRIIVQ